MEFLELSPLFTSRNIPVALWQMVAVVILYGVFIFAGQFKWGVIVSYFLVAYLIFGSDNRIFWVDLFGGQVVGIFSYAVICFITVSVGIAGLFRGSH
ncbi:MAG: hypothetical protein ACE5G9_07565 [Nitrospinales bacterium]